MRRYGLVMVMLAAPSHGQIVGPPTPPPLARTTPAEQAIALYRSRLHPAPAQPCRREGGSAITVCGSGRSEYRLPLPNERSGREGVRIETGEADHVGVGGSPVAIMPSTGVRLTVKGGVLKGTLLGGD